MDGGNKMTNSEYLDSVLPEKMVGQFLDAYKGYYLTDKEIGFNQAIDLIKTALLLEMDEGRLTRLRKLDGVKVFEEVMDCLSDIGGKYRDEVGKMITDRMLDTFGQTQRLDELETEIEAWHKAFGTSQLSHALARLEKAEQTLRGKEK